MKVKQLKYYKLHNEVISPKFATDGSACFDIHCYLPKYTDIVTYEMGNKKILRHAQKDIETEEFLNLSNIDELPPSRVAVYEKMNRYQQTLVSDLYFADNMRKITGDYVINDRLAWAVLEKLSKKVSTRNTN